jgi:hypothetical protein
MAKKPTICLWLAAAGDADMVVAVEGQVDK